MIIHKSPLNSCFYQIFFPYFSITFHDLYLCTGCYYLVLLVFDMITWLLYCFELDFRFCFNSILLLLLSSFIFVFFQYYFCYISILLLLLSFFIFFVFFHIIFVIHLFIFIFLKLFLLALIIFQMISDSWLASYWG